MPSKSPQANTLQALQELIQNAERSLQHAKNLLATLVPKTPSKPRAMTEEVGHTYKHEKNQIIEGVFNGRDMVGADKKIYPVPANYASKSKIVQGSRLKVTIKTDGTLQYKIIKEVDFVTTTGTLIRDKDQFVVLSQSGMYHVLPAAVTYVQAHIGDRLAVRIPRDGTAVYAAIDAIVPAEVGMAVA